WWHIAQVQRLVQTGGWLPRGAGGEVYLNTGVWYAVLAGLCRVLGCTALRLWIVLPAVLAPVLVLSAAWTSRRLLGPERALAGTLAFVVLFEGTHLDPWRELGYPR